MTMYGANPEQLTTLGTTLKQQVPPIETLVRTVTSVLAGTMWEGPARQRFEEDWNSTFRTALERLKTAFESAGNDCVMRAQDLERVMGSTR